MHYAYLTKIMAKVKINLIFAICFKLPEKINIKVKKKSENNMQ